VGLMSHFTNSAPDLEAAKHFWIDFMGGELYTVGPAITQLVLAGATVDLFAAVPARAPVPPAPGSIRQQYRFRIPPDALQPWIERAEQWGVRMTMLAQEDLLRLTLVVHGAGGYHAGLVARYSSIDDLRADAERYRDRVARLDAISAPFTARTGLALAASG